MRTEALVWQKRAYKTSKFVHSRVICLNYFFFLVWGTQPDPGVQSGVVAELVLGVSGS